MAASKLHVSIILVNYNGWQDTIECLESLFKLDYQQYKIFVVDNGSTDGSMQYIKAWANGEINCNLGSNYISQKLAFPPSRKPIFYSEMLAENKSNYITEIDINIDTKLILIQSLAN